MEPFDEVVPLGAYNLFHEFIPYFSDTILNSVWAYNYRLQNKLQVSYKTYQLQAIDHQSSAIFTKHNLSKFTYFIVYLYIYI